MIPDPPKKLNVIFWFVLFLPTLLAIITAITPLALGTHFSELAIISAIAWLVCSLLCGVRLGARLGKTIGGKILFSVLLVLGILAVNFCIVFAGCSA